MKWVILFLYSLCFLPIWGFLLLDPDTISLSTIFIGLLYTSVSYDIVRTELIKEMPTRSRYVVLLFPFVYVVTSILTRPFNFLRPLDPIIWAFLLLLTSMYWLHGYFRVGANAFRKWFILLFFCYFYIMGMHPYWKLYQSNQAYEAHQNSYVSTIEGIDLKVTSSDGAEADIKKILDNANDSLIYMDFWASWCAPCVAQFPYSDSIQQVLRDEPVKFMYLSIDDSQLDWMKGQELYELLDKDSYWIQNARHSEFMEKHQIRSIPRYVLIGRNGEIIDADAPRPSEDELVQMIRKNLKK